MSRILVVYATTDGHTAKIAQAIKQRLIVHGHEVDIANAATSEPQPMSYHGVIVAALRSRRPLPARSCPMGTRPRARAQYRHHRLRLRVPRRAAARRQSRPRLQMIVDAFLKKTLWHPSETIQVAGALNIPRTIRWFDGS